MHLCVKIVRKKMNELALFAGAGGGILGGKLLGWRTVCAVEWEQYPACVLAARQNDGFLPPFPIWDDVQTFDGKPWQGIVDVVSGGFPCQDISAAGKGAGIDGERSGMWGEMARIIGEVRPQYAFIENSPMLTTRGLERVLADLAKMGFDAEWGVLSAADVGANHLRERIWIVAKNTKQCGFFSYTDNRSGRGKQQSESPEKTNGNVANSDSRLCRGRGAIGSSRENDKRGLHTTKIKQTEYDIWSKTFGCSFVRRKENTNINWWEIEPKLDRVVNGLADRMVRIKAIGNGQVPLCAATAWRLLKERLDGYKQRGVAKRM
jgi:DNA (cytosine-5)-methyltransferase 1